MARADDVRARMAALRAMPYPEAPVVIASQPRAAFAADLVPQDLVPQDLVPEELMPEELMPEALPPAVPDHHPSAPAQQAVAEAGPGATAEAALVAGVTAEDDLDPAEEAELREIFGEGTQAERQAPAAAPETQAPGVVITPSGTAAMPPPALGPAVIVTVAAAAAQAGDSANRPARALLPDIEEINSSLRHGTAVHAAPRRTSAPQTGSSSFGRGFAFVILIAAMLAGLYGGADVLADSVPSMATGLAAYVAKVDALRLWLDLSVQSLLPQG